MPRGNCWYGYGPIYGPGFGAKFGSRGPWFGVPQAGYVGFPGLGWAVYSALAEGPKTDKEVADWISSKMNSQITAELMAPLLQLWTLRGIIKKDNSNKYSLSWTPSPAPANAQ